MAKIRFQLPDHDAPLTIEFQPGAQGYRFTWDDPDSGEAQTHTAQVMAPGPGQGWLEEQGQIQPFYYHRENETLHLWMAGQTYILPLADLRPQRGVGGKSGLPASGDIKSPMPGTILQIKVAAGAVVEAGQAVIIMESMKMEMTLAAPMGGQVKEIRCQEGQLVEMGTLLASLTVILETETDESQHATQKS